jgi:hypothetical protein
MARSRISYNIHAQAVHDHDRLMQHLKKIQPASVLVMDGLGLAQEIKAVIPGTIVIHRNWGATEGDDNAFAKVSPEQWLELRGKEAEGGIFLYTTNEPGWGQDVIDWHVKLIEMAAPRRVPLVIGNWAVGTPQPDQWVMARRMLELLDEHRDLFILGLHEYACGVITSGLVGGPPDDPSHPNFIPMENWPQDVSHLTMWHCGRFKFVLDFCDKAKIKPPRIIMTEHGMDDVSDIKPWSETLKKTSPYLNIRGWKSATDQWNDWFGGKGWSPQRAYFEQMAWADRVIYWNSVVEAQLIYCWGHRDPMWEQFDICEADEFHSLLEKYAQQKPAPVKPAASKPTIHASFAPAASHDASDPAAKQPAAFASAKPQAVPDSEFTFNLTADDLAVITAGLRAIDRVTMDPTVIAAFRRLADVLERGKQ